MGFVNICEQVAFIGLDLSIFVSNLFLFYVKGLVYGLECCTWLKFTHWRGAEA